MAVAALEIDRWLSEVPPPPGLDGTLRCVWFGDLHAFSRPVPDECVDITWVADGSLWVTGPESRSWTPGAPSAATAVGVRFTPGAGPAVLRTDATQLLDARVPLAAVWGDRRAGRLAEQLAGAADDRARAHLLAAVVQTTIGLNGGGDTDPIGRDVRAALAHPQPPSVRTLAGRCGVSERQLLRRCRAAFGFGPARLARILRIHRALRIGRLEQGSARLADVAVAAGFADQQHLSHEVRALIGVTPRVLFALHVGSVQDPTGQSWPPSTHDRPDRCTPDRPGP